MIDKDHIKIINNALSNMGSSYSLINEHSLEKIEIGAGEVSIYKFNSGNTTFIARIMPITEALHERVSNMVTASKSFYSPKLYYSEIDEKGAICISEFFVNDYKTDRSSKHYLRCLAINIKKLHQDNLLVSSKNLLQFLVEMDEWLEEAHIPFPTHSEEEISIYRKNFKALENLWFKFENEIRPVHHDLNPTNILYDGIRLAIIDFDTVSLDSIYVDLGVAANFYCFDDNSINSLLSLYFEDDLAEEKIHKFNFIRPFCLVLHALWLASSAGFTKKVLSQTPPSFRELKLLLLNGELDLNLKENVLNLSVSMFTEAIKLMLSMKFKDAIELLQNEKL